MQVEYKEHKGTVILSMMTQSDMVTSVLLLVFLREGGAGDYAGHFAHVFLRDPDSL